MTIQPTAFYLVNEDLVIKVENSTRLGRIKGEAFLEHDMQLSDLHCELSYSDESMFVQDLNSSTGVMVNSVRIKPMVAYQLNVGDAVTIGSSSYKVYEEGAEVRALIPKFNMRREKRPKNIHGIKNLYTFFVAPPLYLVLYISMILIAIGISIYNNQIKLDLPEDLGFISTLYKEKVFQSGIILVVLVWIFSLLHSFFMVTYLNRNPGRRIFGFIMYFGAIFFFAELPSGPMGKFKDYSDTRQSIKNMKIEKRAIVDLKNVTTYRNNLISSYTKIIGRFDEADQRIIKSDFKQMLAKTDQLIKDITITEVKR